MNIDTRRENYNRHLLSMKIVWEETMSTPFNEFTHTNIEYIRTKLLKERYEKYRTNSLQMPPIKKVHFNPPLTIVIWEDGTKTFVKAHGENFDAEKGLAMAISKKYFNNKYSYKEAFEKWIPEEMRESEETKETELSFTEELVNACEDFKKRFLRDASRTIFRVEDPEDAPEATCAACTHVHDSDICEDCHTYSNYEKKESSKENPLQKAYDILVKARNDELFDVDMDELIGYLGEALD